MVMVMAHDFPAEATVQNFAWGQRFSVECRRCRMEMGQTFEPEDRLGLQERHSVFWSVVQECPAPCRVPVVGW